MAVSSNPNKNELLSRENQSARVAEAALPAAQTKREGEEKILNEREKEFNEYRRRAQRKRTRGVLTPAAPDNAKAPGFLIRRSSSHLENGGKVCLQCLVVSSIANGRS
jgi:hypothetical protein